VTAPPQPDRLPLLAVYADESCLGNGREGSNPGGAAGLIEYRHPRTGVITRYDYWISEPATTNNRMALRSVIEAFRIASRRGRRLRVVFTTDSQYLVRGMTDWVHGWMRRGWRRKEGAVENLGLWQEAVEAVRPHQYVFRWVRGHAGHPQNEYANHLAIRAAREQTASAGAVESSFDEWLAGCRARGTVHAEPDPFPEYEASVPGRPFPASPAPSLT
jgi:ribonuclease HI